MNKPNLKKNRRGGRGYGRCRQGVYICKRPEKYVGNVNNVIYRSSLELSMFKYCDHHKNVLKWGSEIIVVPYFDKTTAKKRRYFTDVYIEYFDKNNNILKTIIEIKPHSQTLPPSTKGKNYEKRLNEYIKNKCKWQAATIYAKNNGMQFQILTEKDIKGKK